MSDQEQNDAEDRALRNSVIAARRAVENAGHGPEDNRGPKIEVTQGEYARQELGFEIPVDAVPLPSSGLVYAPGHALHNKRQVEFRSMTARDEDILMNQAFAKQGTMINHLINACLMDKNVNVDDLLIGDRNAILVALRSVSYDPKYAAMLKCQSCGNSTTLEVNLPDLDIKPLEISPSEAWTNSFELKLPVTKKTVNFKFLTCKDEIDLIQTSQSRRKKGLKAETAVTEHLAAYLLSVEGNYDRNYISKFCMFMPARDSMILRKYIRENEPGIDVMVDFECDSCNHSGEVPIPFGPSFFWPGSE
jgi:hypothetical protein